MVENIVFVIPQSLLFWRGVERWIAEISKALSEKGLNVSVISFSTFPEYVQSREEIIRRYIEVKRRLGKTSSWLEVRSLDFHVPRKLGPVRRFLKYHGIRIPILFKNLIKLVEILKFSKVVYMPVGCFYQALNLTLITVLIGGIKKKVIWGLHARPNYREFVLARTFIHILKRLGIEIVIHTVNITDYVVLRSLLRGNVDVVYLSNFVDTDFFNPERGVKDIRTFKVLFVGALLPEKGADIVLDVSKLLREHLSESVRVIVASVGGPLIESFKRAAQYGFIEFRGFVSDNELARLYASSHCVIMPSRDEAFGLVALEALASGTPVVSSDLPAFKVMVKNGLTGFRVPSFDPEDYVKAILKLYELWKKRSYKYRLLCQNARREAVSRFSLKIIINKFIESFIGNRIRLIRE